MESIDCTMSRRKKTTAKVANAQYSSESSSNCLPLTVGLPLCIAIQVGFPTKVVYSKQTNKTICSH